jgi:hypothetical protein
MQFGIRKASLLDGQVALVTGAGRGIDCACSEIVQSLVFSAIGVGGRYANQSKAGVDLRLDFVFTSESERSVYLALNQRILILILLARFKICIVNRCSTVPGCRRPK